MISFLSSSSSKFPLALKLLGFLVPSTIFLVLSMPLQAQQASAPMLQQRIQHEVDLIQKGEQSNIPSEQLAILWAHLASDYYDQVNFSEAENAYTKTLELLSKGPDPKDNYATTLDNLGALYLMMGRGNDAEHCRRAALAIRQKKGDQLGIARSYGNMAEAYLGEHRFKKAERYSSMEYEILLSLGDLDKRDEVASLLTRAYARCFSGKCSQGLEDARQAHTITNTAFQPNSLPTGQALFALGFTEWKSGDPERAQDAMRQGIDILEDQMSEANPYLMGARMQYQQCLITAHRDKEAREVAEQVAASMHQSRTPCPNCTVNVYGISNSWK